MDLSTDAAGDGSPTTLPGAAVKVYLLLTEDGRRRFYGEMPKVTEEPDPPHHGLRGWFERRRKRLATLWERSDGRVIRLLRRIWEGLSRRTYPDEAWLVRLRGAPAIEVRHPTTLTGDDARA